MASRSRDISEIATQEDSTTTSAGSPILDSEDVMSVADLTFDHQIVIWSVRMFLQGSGAFARVRSDFNSALPPAAARIAYTAVERIIGTLRRYGRRNLRFGCMCTPLLTRDEISVLVLMLSLQDNSYPDMMQRADVLVLEDGAPVLIDSFVILLAALAARQDGNDATLPAEIGDCIVH